MTCRDCGKPTGRRPNARYCLPCAKARNVASLRLANRRWAHSEKGRAFLDRRNARNRVQPRPCVRCGEPARAPRALHCLPCRNDLHRIYSREYRRSPRGKIKLAEWHDRHPGYSTQRTRMRAKPRRIEPCQAPLCKGTLVQSRNGQRKWCQACCSAFYGRAYMLRQTRRSQRRAA